MKMEAESNRGFRHEQTLGSALSRHTISFQSGSRSTTAEMIPTGSYYGVSSAAGMIIPGNSGIVNRNLGTTQAGNSSGSVLQESVPGLNHDAGLAVEWSVEEQFKLEEGLVKYADQPSIMRYIKIAAALRDKTVRDVALRCSWMTRKRRKQEDHNLGKKMKDGKDKVAEPSLKANLPSASPLNFTAYSIFSNNRDQSDCMPHEELSGTRHLLEQNNQVFYQISANLSSLKLQDNIDHFFSIRSNITTILNEMRNLPGIMSEMPPLPVSISEELASSILPNTSQAMMFGTSNGIHLKPEPGC